VPALVGLAVSACGGGSDESDGGDELPAAFQQREAALPSALLRARALASTTESALAPLSADGLMDWAQQVYPDFFPGSAATQVFEPYLYRYYSASGNYLGVAGGRVYVLGPVSDGTLLDVGALADFTALVATDWRTARPASDEEAARVLLQAQFSARREEIAQVRALGFAGWFDAQLKAPRSITAWDWLEQRGYHKVDRDGHYEQRVQMFFAVWYQLIATPDAMRKRLALCLSEFFVVSSNSVNAAWRGTLVCNYWDLLVEHAFGNFRSLLGKLPTHAAMGSQLSIVGSKKADPSTGRMPDENFARELMQLFTIGLVELNADGTEKVDARGQRRETYSQDDVTQLARVFTGYHEAKVQTFSTTPLGRPGTYPILEQARTPLQLDLNQHSTEDVRFLGLHIAGNLAPNIKIEKALDHLFLHPNVGPFFGRQMIQRLVTSNPSPGYVARVAAVFNNNGQGVRGDLAATFSRHSAGPRSARCRRSGVHHLWQAASADGALCSVRAQFWPLFQGWELEAALHGTGGSMGAVSLWLSKAQYPAARQCQWLCATSGAGA
jgi:uncharacterized protein (DUF1800 family)